MAHLIFKNLKCLKEPYHPSYTSQHQFPFFSHNQLNYLKSEAGHTLVIPILVSVWHHINESHFPEPFHLAVWSLPTLLPQAEASSLILKIPYLSHTLHHDSLCSSQNFIYLLPVTYHLIIIQLFL